MLPVLCEGHAVIAWCDLLLHLHICLITIRLQALAASHCMWLLVTAPDVQREPVNPATQVAPQSDTSRTLTLSLQVEASQSMIRIVGLSATLPNYKDVAAFLGVSEPGLFYFDASYRPVPLAMEFIGATDRNIMACKATMDDICYNKVWLVACKWLAERLDPQTGTAWPASIYHGTCLPQSGGSQAEGLVD